MKPHTLIRKRGKHNGYEKIQLYDEVETLKTGERAFVVEMDTRFGDSIYLLEIKDKNELPHFYERKDFKFIKG